MVWVKKQNNLCALYWLSELKYICVQRNIHFARAHATEKIHCSSIAWLPMPKGRGTKERWENRTQRYVNYSALSLYLRGEIFIPIPNYFIEWVPEVDDFTSLSSYDEDRKAAGFRGLDTGRGPSLTIFEPGAWGPFPSPPEQRLSRMEWVSAPWLLAGPRDKGSNSRSCSEMRILISTRRIRSCVCTLSQDCVRLACHISITGS